jgi:hypothetical protein
LRLPFDVLEVEEMRMIRWLSLVACLLGAPLAFAQTVECTGGPPGWIQAEGTGCRLWNLCRQHRETVTWSGVCVNGFAEGLGVQQWFLEGKPAGRQEGNMRSGKLNGFGVSTFPNGDRYEGEWRDSRWHGRGIYVHSDGDRYEGEWRNGQANGRGVATSARDRHDGEWRNNKAHGRGIATWSGGDRYEGEWRDDRLSGRGVYTWANGDRYEGEFRDDKRTGRGVYTWAAHGTGNPAIWYEGEFVDGELHGNGVILFLNGDWYKGEWREGRAHGQGTMQFVDGHTYTGTWHHGCVRQGNYMAWLGATEAECEARLSQ